MSVERPDLPRPGPMAKLVGNQRIAGYELSLRALFTQLAKDEAGFGVIAADIDDVDPAFLELGDEGSVVLLAGGIGFIHRLRHAGLVEGLLRLIG